jgi:integrase
MFKYSDWSVDATKILSRRELAAVLADLERRSIRSRQARLNRVIFRLACCCGLRASEIARLQLADVTPPKRDRTSSRVPRMAKARRAERYRYGGTRGR